MSSIALRSRRHTRGLCACLLLLLLITGCSSPPSPSAAPPPPPQAAATPLTTPLPVPQLPPPQVDPERLFQDLQALSQERATTSDRAQTRDYLTQVLQPLGWTIEEQRFDEGGVNLIAKHPNAPPTANIVLVTAHYDTVPGSPGADDNATGVAALLEVARLFATRPTVRSLQLVWFDQEEIGLRGSLAYTAVPENLARLEAVLNLEMLGYACREAGCQTYPEGLPIAPPSDRGDFLGAIVDQEHAALLEALQQSGDSTLPPIVALPVPLKGLLTPDLLRSDHAPFWARNIGAVMVADTANFRNPHYHQPSDLPETLDRAFLTGSTQIVVNAISRWLDQPTALTATSRK